MAVVEACMATGDADEPGGGEAAAGGAATGSAGESASGGWRRWRDAVVAAARWAVDVFRGHARSRHLDNREK